MLKFFKSNNYNLFMGIIALLLVLINIIKPTSMSLLLSGAWLIVAGARFYVYYKVRKVNATKVSKEG